MKKISAFNQLYDNVRDRLIQDLEELRDPEDGSKIVEKVYKKEEVYHGPRLFEAPDILIEPARGYWIVGSFSYPWLVEHTRRETGRHEIDGILVMGGRGIKEGASIQNAELIDLAPTILRMFNITAGGMDGKVLEEALEAE